MQQDKGDEEIGSEVNGHSRKESLNVRMRHGDDDETKKAET